ncbi:MAG TPA: hypothetical protein VFY74_06160, partial [Methyloceanibacter sp.]|nr:hypothetical protein [Methyloceanibacter sp.]
PRLFAGIAKSMSQKPEKEGLTTSAAGGPPPARSALPGRGGLARISAAFWNSLRGLQEGLSTESAIKQEVAIACVLLPLSFFIAKDRYARADFPSPLVGEGFPPGARSAQVAQR